MSEAYNLQVPIPGNHNAPRSGRRGVRKTERAKGQGIVSRERVESYGEVLTPPHIVEAMLDLVRHETERIDSRFLEPACGDGNFLAAVLARKLDAVDRRYRKSPVERERYAVLAVGSLYGIDILGDNVARCRERLYRLVRERFPDPRSGDFRRSIRYILERNIVHGDALSLQTATKPARPIVFSEWSLVNGSRVKRRDFAFHELLKSFEMRGDPVVSDTGEPVFLPEPIRDFPLTHYRELADVDS